MAIKEIRSLDDITPDDRNANKHTLPGASLMEDSIREDGFGDSITVDKNGKIISGNQRGETVADLQMTDVIVVQSDGTKPIIHQRTDLDLEVDERAKRLAIRSNRVGELNLDWDGDILAGLQDEGLNLGELGFDDAALEEILPAEDGSEPELKRIVVKEPKEVVWVLIAIPIEQWPHHHEAVESLRAAAIGGGIVMNDTAPKAPSEPQPTEPPQG